jgi:hypothetical protein
VLVAHGSANNGHRHEGDEKRRPRVAQREQFFADVDYLDAELLAQLACGRIPVRLATLALSAGKFPETAMPFVRRTLADEQAFSVGNDSCDDADDIGRHDGKVARVGATRKWSGAEVYPVSDAHAMIGALPFPPRSSRR